jgi:hypothetical protein
VTEEAHTVEWLRLPIYVVEGNNVAFTVGWYAYSGTLRRSGLSSVNITRIQSRLFKVLDGDVRQ